MYKITVPAAVWQWDINDTVAVEGIENISEWQVHFAAAGDTTALVIEIHRDMTAYIPNQLVELGTAIYAYLYNVREQRAYTETAILIPVSVRPKPNDYISEPTDVLTWGQLRADIGTLSQLVTEDKTNLVAAINELHGDIKTAYGEIDNIETAMNEQDKSLTAIQSDISEIKQSITDINATDSEQSSAIAQAQQDITALKSENQSQAQDISNIKQDITDIESIDTAQSQSIAQIQESIADINSTDSEQSQSISGLQQSISNINATDTAQSQAIAQVQQDIDTLANADSALSQQINSLASSVDSAFAEVETALDGKQPIGNYVTSVNGNAPDKRGNVNIDVQTYTAGDGIRINEGAISVTNPMDDEQVSAGTTWSSAKIISSVSQPFSQSGSIITCYPVDGSPLHVVSEITAVQEGEGDPSPDNVRPISGWDSANLIRCGRNLLPQTYSSTESNGVTWNVREDKSIEVSGYATGYSAISESLTFLVHKNFTAYINVTNYNNLRLQLNYHQNSSSTPLSILPNVQTEYYGSINYDDLIITVKRNNNNVETKGLIYPMLFSGEDIPDYEPYRGQTYTADFGETVYGGTLDWATGVLTVDSVLYQFTGNESINQSSNTTETAYCVFIANISPSPVTFQYADMSNSFFSHGSVSTVETMSSEDNTFAYNTNPSPFIKVQKTKIPNWDEQADTTQKVALMTNYIKSQYQAGTPLTVCYTIEPYTIQLTPAQILAISGINTVYCDTGDVTVTGYEDPRTTIANLSARIAALESAAANI